MSNLGNYADGEVINIISGLSHNKCEDGHGFTVMANNSYKNGFDSKKIIGETEKIDYFPSQPKSLSPQCIFGMYSSPTSAAAIAFMCWAAGDFGL